MREREVARRLPHMLAVALSAVGIVLKHCVLLFWRSNKYTNAKLRLFFIWQNKKGEKMTQRCVFVCSFRLLHCFSRARKTCVASWKKMECRCGCGRLSYMLCKQLRVCAARRVCLRMASRVSGQMPCRAVKKGGLTFKC